jgi:hypothetical protein
MLEHAIWLDLVQRCLQEAFLFELVIVVFVDRGELLSLFTVSISTRLGMGNIPLRSGTPSMQRSRP